MKLGMKLFENEDDDDDVELSKIKMNEEFARRIEHNKKREDLQIFEELKKMRSLKMNTTVIVLV
ncbi:unnamed protein product, partial [Cuscuta europaea]